MLCLATHAGKLYAGLGTGSGNGEVWEYNGSSWTKVAGDGLNSSWSLRSVQSLLSHSNGRLYAGTGGISAGDGEVWEQNGTTWSRLGGDGVNGSWNTNHEFAWSMAELNGAIVVGIGESAGKGEVRRIGNPRTRCRIRSA